MSSSVARPSRKPWKGSRVNPSSDALSARPERDFDGPVAGFVESGGECGTVFLQIVYVCQQIQVDEPVAPHEVDRDVVDVAALASKGREAIGEDAGQCELAVPEPCPVRVDAGGAADEDDAAALAGEGQRITRRARRAHGVVDER